MSLSREAILAADDIRTEPVACPEWGDEPVLIKGMTGAERDDFEKSVRRNGEMDLSNYRAKFLVRVIVNDNGTRIFADVDAGLLGGKSAGVLNRLWEAASQLSGMGDDEEEAAEGNSEPTGGDDSSSSSPETSDAPEPSSSPESVPES